MTNPYNMNYGYGQEVPFQYQQYQNFPNIQPQVERRGSSALGNTITSASLGFAGGTLIAGGIDYYKSRKPIKDGEVSESFVKKVFDNMIKKDYVSKGKSYIKQKLDILNNIEGATTPEKFKALMEKNKKYCSTLFDGLSLKNVCDMVTSDNIKGKISTIKEKVQASLKNEYQTVKDAVKLCWDSENKKFVKPDNVDKKLFKIIKNTKNSVNWKKVFKTGGITALIFGALGLGYSALTKSE